MMQFVILDADSKICRTAQYFSVSSPFFSIIVSPALLQSHRNPIHAAAPFPRNLGAAPGEHYFQEPSSWQSPMTAPKP
jgi:hypothetical protein